MADEATTASTEVTETTTAASEAAAGTQAADTAQGTTVAATEPAKPVVPETYELALPKDSTLDPAVLERTAATARELGLSQEHAQKMLDSVVAETATREAALLAQYQPGGDAWAKQVDGWGTAALADAEIGGTPEKLAENVALAQKVLGTFGSEQMNTFLHTTGFGSHPEVVRMFAKMGRTMGEGSFVPGGSAADNSEEARLARMYPTMAKQG